MQHSLKSMRMTHNHCYSMKEMRTHNFWKIQLAPNFLGKRQKPSEEDLIEGLHESENDELDTQATIFQRKQ